MVIAALIGIMVSIVVGISLIPMIMETMEEATKDSEDVPTAASALLNILPIVFVVVLILGAVAWIGGSGISFRSEKKKVDYTEEDRIWKTLDIPRPSSDYSAANSIHKEEVLEVPETPEVPEIPRAPVTSSKSQGKPPWARK